MFILMKIFVTRKRQNDKTLFESYTGLITGGVYMYEWHNIF